MSLLEGGDRAHRVREGPWALQGQTGSNLVACLPFGNEVLCTPG